MKNITILFRCGLAKKQGWKVESVHGAWAVTDPEGVRFIEGVKTEKGAWEIVFGLMRIRAKRKGNNDEII